MQEAKLEEVQKWIDKGYKTPKIVEVCSKDEYMLVDDNANTVTVDKEIYGYVKGLNNGTRKEK